MKKNDNSCRGLDKFSCTHVWEKNFPETLVFKRTFLGYAEHQREGNFPKEFSEPKENQIMLEKQKQRLITSASFPPTTSV